MFRYRKNMASEKTGRKESFRGLSPEVRVVKNKKRVILHYSLAINTKSTCLYRVYWFMANALHCKFSLIVLKKIFTCFIMLSFLLVV